MEFVPTEIEGVFELRSQVFTDDRGQFVKSFHAAAFADHGLNTSWREQFWSVSGAGVIRGLHFQVPPADHAKLVCCCAGSVWDVVVDLRVDSPTYGRHISRELHASSGTALYIPRGMAHGFQALADGSLLHYSTETAHEPSCDSGVRWDSCGIPWPLSGKPITSVRDAGFPTLANFTSPFRCQPA